MSQEKPDLPPLPTTARVVIIGGGAVGASSLYHLALAGCTDTVLLEKTELTAGSTWHAAGNCPTFSNSWAVMNMQRYSTELYRGLAEKVDYPMNYHVTGAIRLAHNEERMREFERSVSMSRYQGMDVEMMSVQDMQDIYPFMEGHDLAGGLYDPMDGDIDPAQLTQAYAKGARDLGAKIIRFTPATGVRRENGEWIVETARGEIRCEFVVNAAGYYAQRVGEWFKPYGGRTVPMMVMSHQYLLTDEVPEIAAYTAEHGKKLPLLRDVDSSYYLRQEKTGFNLGPYESNGKGHWMHPDDPMPEDFSFQLYPDDLDRIEWYIEDAMARVPLLGTQGVSRVINGPIPYAPDGLPLIGPMPGVPNAFEACVFTFGIAQSGGAGKVLAEWILEGETEWDMWATDPRRFTGHADQDYSNQKGLEVYCNEYAIHFPHHEWPKGRDKKLSPLHAKLLESSAQMGCYNGWERANWFAQEGEDTSEQSTLTFKRSGPWEAGIKREVEAVSTGAGVLDLTGFSRYTLTGEGAGDWLLSQIASGLPNVGRVGLIYFADSRGHLKTEMSLFNHGDDHFTLITAAAAQWHDFELLSRNLPEHLQLTDETDAMSTLLVTGPKARDILSAMTDADLTQPWLSFQSATVAGQSATLARVSFAGELGWEVHLPQESALPVYEALLQEGAKPFGMYALNSMRIEKGYKGWKSDLNADYTLLELGLKRFLDLDKPQDFPGKAALQAEAKDGPQKHMVLLSIDSPEFDAPAVSILWHEGKMVGETTSSAYGHRLGKCLSLALVKPELAQKGQSLEVEIFGKRYPAIVETKAALYDPKNERLKA